MKNGRLLVYVAGPYTAVESGEELLTVDYNIEAARKVAAALWDDGHFVICPHANTAHFEDIATKTSYDDFLEGCYRMIRKCDAVVLLPNWKLSGGARKEMNLARHLGLPIYVWPNRPESVR